jgi:hypothetical protein
MYLNKVWIILLLSIAIMSLVSCSPGSENSTGKQPGIVQVSGSFDQPPATSTKSISSSISRIGAVSIVLGELTTDIIDEMILEDVNTDGSFSIDLPQEENTEYLLLLIDDNAVNQFDKIPGFVSLPLDDSTQLEAMPIADLETNIELGGLEQTESDALADVDIETLQEWFGLSFAEIVQSALIDDASKNLKNIINNSDPVTNQEFRIQQQTAINKALSTAINQFSTPGPPFATDTYPDTWTEDIVRYVRVDVHNPHDHSFDDLSNGNIFVEIFPDHQYFLEDFFDGIRRYGPDSPITVENELVILNSDDVPGEYWFDWGVPSSDPVVYGIHYNGIQVASIDTGFFKPFDEDRNFRYFHPSIRVNTDENDTILSIELKMYYHDSIQDTYIEMEDTEILNNFGGYMISIMPLGEGHQGEQFNNLDYIDSFQNEWKITGESNDVLVDRIDIGMSFGESGTMGFSFFEDGYFHLIF